MPGFEDDAAVARGEKTRRAADGMWVWPSELTARDADDLAYEAKVAAARQGRELFQIGLSSMMTSYDDASIEIWEC